MKRAAYLPIFPVVLALLFLSLQIPAQTNSPQDQGKSGFQSKPAHIEKGFFGLSPGDLAAWATAAASIVNLLLIFAFFICANRQHERERKKDFKNREAERKAKVAGFWIEELIMRQHHALVHEFFDNFEERLKHQAAPVGAQNHAELLKNAQQEIIVFKQQLHKIEQQVIEPLQWIHEDFNDLIQIRNDVEDLVTGELQRIPGMPREANGDILRNPEQRLAELRRNFFQTIHKTETKVLLNSTHEI